MRLIILVLFLVFTSSLFAQNTNFLNTSFSGDLVYQQGLNEESEASNQLTVREAELYFYAAIDPKFNGVLSLTVHGVEEEPRAELHEGYFESSLLIPGINFKVGQFFIDQGRLNRIHTHDFTFTYAPTVYDQFFATEGILGKGIETSTFFGSDINYEFTLGLIEGELGHNHAAAGHDHHEEEEEEEEEISIKSPSAYFKLSAFSPKGAGGHKTSLNGFFGNNSEEGRFQLVGLDYTFKKRIGNRLVHIIEAEAWGKFSSQASHFSEGHDPFYELQSKKKAGGYLSYAYGLTNQWQIGAITEYFRMFEATSEDYNDVRGEVYGISPFITWSNSEFFRTRLTVGSKFYDIDGHQSKKDFQASLQFVFFLGSHPTHDF